MLGSCTWKEANQTNNSAKTYLKLYLQAADFLASELGPPVEESYFYNSFKRWDCSKKPCRRI